MVKADLYIFVLPIRVGYNWLSVLPGAWSPEHSLSKFYKKKNLDKQSYCRNLPQSPSDHKLKLAAKYSSSFEETGETINYWPASLSTSAQPSLGSSIPELRRLRSP